jgi:hypothetical protein
MVIVATDYARGTRSVRTFDDDTGRRWDVAVSEESYGTQRLLFAVRQGNEFRAQVLALDSRYDAERLLLGLSTAELRALLAGAEEWQPG